VAAAVLRLFSYGTLLTGALDPQIDRLLAQHCRSRYPASVQGRLYCLGRFPGALPSHHRNDRIRGEILELERPQRCLPMMDRYEGADPNRPERGLFRRRPAQARPPAGARVRAEIYWYHGPLTTARRIPDGDWLRWLEGS